MASSFFGEVRIVTELERLYPMRLESASMPDTEDARIADADRGRHTACAPVCRVPGFVLRRQADLPPSVDQYLGVQVIDSLRVVVHRRLLFA